jgi:hypothetical protein
MVKKRFGGVHPNGTVLQHGKDLALKKVAKSTAFPGRWQNDGNVFHGVDLLCKLSSVRVETLDGAAAKPDLSVELM